MLASHLEMAPLFSSSPLKMTSLLSKTEGLAPTSPEFEALDPEDMRRRRARLVAELVLDGDINKEAVRDAMLRVPRHLFVPAESRAEAYENHPLPIGHDQTISQPAVVALMTEALELSGRERVLEIGTGSGYQTAVLSHLAAEVDSIERIVALGDGARDLLGRLGYKNVNARVGDGYAGWPSRAPYDRIIATASPPDLPEALLTQLAEGGVMVTPIGELSGWGQTLVRVRKVNGRGEIERICSVRFVPMVEGSDPEGPSWN